MGIFDRAKDTATTKRDPNGLDHNGLDQGGLDQGGLDQSGPEQGDQPAEAEVTFESDATESVADGQEPSQPPV